MSETLVASRISDLLEFAPEGAILVDADDRIAWVNERAETYFDLSREPVVGEVFAQVVQAHIAPLMEDADAVSERLSGPEHLPQGSDLYCHLVAGSGLDERWLRCYRTPVKGDESEGAAVVWFDDITARRRSAKLEALLDKMNDAILVADAETGQLVDANRKATELFGYTIEEFRTMHQSELHPAEKREEYREIFRQHVAEGNAVFRDLWAVDADGERIPVDISASLVNLPSGDHLLGIFRDLTFEKTVEKELKAQHRHYRTLFQESVDAVILTDPDGEIIDVNPAALRLFGRERHDVVGDDLKKLLVDSAAWEPLRDRLLVHEIVEDYELKFTSEGADEFIGLVNSSSWRTLEGDLEAYQHIVRDVTEERMREQQLELLNRMLRHDIGNDMHTILGFADMIRDEVGDQHREYLDLMRRSGRRIIELTESARLLMEMFRNQVPASQQAVNLTDLVKREAQTLADTYESASVTWEFIPDQPVVVRGNSTLSSVFGNLLTNAVRHNDKPAAQIDVRLTEDEETAVVTVADNGPGIAEAQKASIFGKGEKGLASSGTGIGLYLVGTLVEQFGGRVWVEDNDPVGSVFYVELPKASSVE